MRRSLLLLFALCACGGASRPEMLSDLPRFDGHVRIEAGIGGRPRVLEGALRFDRGDGSVELVRELDGVRVELSKAHRDSPLRKVVGGASVPVELADEGDLALLLTVVTGLPDAGAEVRAVPGGYVIEAGGQRLQVTVSPAAKEK